MAHRRARVAALLTVAAWGSLLAFQSGPDARPGPSVPVAPARIKALSPVAERQIAQRWLRSLELKDMVAQLFVLTTFGEAPPKRSREYRDLVHAISQLRVGGLIVVNRTANGSLRQAEPHRMAVFLNRMQKLARIPLLVGADFERGASMRVTDTIKYPHLMAYGAANDLKLTRALGAATAREARALGVHWVFAPDADVNNNPDNPIINVRSFGEDPQRVAAHVQAFIEGAHSDFRTRILVTAKHFPGHGDTNVDTHLGLAKLGAGRARMEQVELVPFRAAIAKGVDAVMTAHLAVPAVEELEIPATVSSSVLTGLLRQNLKFDGLIVTDAMDMQGLTGQFPSGEASVRAIEAGADVLLMPQDPDAEVEAVLKAIREGRLTRKRIQASVMRVLTAKARVGLQRARLVDAEQLVDELDSPEAAQEAQQAAERALTLIKNDRNTLPIRSPEKSCLFVLSENRYGQQGRAMMAEAKRLAPAWPAVLLDPNVSLLEINDALEKSAACETPVVAAFVTVAAYRGNVALTGNLPALIEGLLTRDKPVALVAIGSPYLLRFFPGVSAYLATFSSVVTSETAAVRAVLGQIPVRGRMPVSIPELAKLGDGLDLASGGQR